MGENPLLAGKMAAAKLRGIQSQGVISTSHIFAMNDQEDGRTTANAIIDQRAMRESDSLAFELAITESNVEAVMCSYNLVNGAHSCLKQSRQKDKRCELAHDGSFQSSLASIVLAGEQHSLAGISVGG